MQIAPSSKHHPLKPRRRQLRIPFGAQKFLAVFEGFEGGFAIGASIVVALSFAGLERHLLIATAFISVIVNGFNAAVIKYSSEHYLDELDGREKRSSFRNYFLPAAIEFFAYIIIGLFSITPLLLIQNLDTAVLLCAVATLSLLFIAGWWRGFMVRLHPWRDGIETMLLGLCIIMVGLASGLATNFWLS